MRPQCEPCFRVSAVLASLSYAMHLSRAHGLGQPPGLPNVRSSSDGYRRRVERALRAGVVQLGAIDHRFGRRLRHPRGATLGAGRAKATFGPRGSDTRQSPASQFSIPYPRRHSDCYVLAEITMFAGTAPRADPFRVMLRFGLLTPPLSGSEWASGGRSGPWRRLALGRSCRRMTGGGRVALRGSRSRAGRCRPLGAGRGVCQRTVGGCRG
jgi:hypothetical protein